MDARLPDNFPAPYQDPDSPEDPARLLAWVEGHAGALCAGCESPLCGHALLHSRAGAGAVPPRCGICLAKVLRLDQATLVGNLTAYVRRRDCYRLAWEKIQQREPDCPLGHSVRPISGESAPSDDGTPGHQADWDAGDLGCGDLLLPLRGRMRALQSGQVLRLIARDPSAPEDLPAWCGVTGHRLLQARHPTYWIQRRED
ncbi:MAG: sulfurtransferase TusA family protein [Gemmataceae bacterium]